MDKNILKILNRELKIAIGCTEPISIAYAASLAKKYLNSEEISALQVYVSKNILKNAMGVTIPKTNSNGIPLAAALGVVAGDADKKLEVLHNLKKDDFKKAHKIIPKIQLELADSPSKLYIEVIMSNNDSRVRVIIENTHTNVTLIESDGKIIKKMDYQDEVISDKPLSLNSIYEFVLNIDSQELEIINESIEKNMKICIEGLNKPYGLQIGGLINSRINNEILMDTEAYAVALTSAGVDARMSGSTLPVVSNSGSGNQGISATIPVVVIGKRIGVSEDKLLQAVTLSHLVTIYIKSKFGRLSALCGATVSATGACCGITYLLGGEQAEIESAIQNMLGNVAGILCDGAKPGCAMKIATCTNAAMQSAQMAIQGISIDFNQGIIEKDVEKSIENFCRLGNQGMDKVDDIILDIMLKK